MENNEENKIREAEIKEPSVLSEIDPLSVKKRKNDWLIELFLFLVLGILVGIAIKTEAVKKLTIGFDDYKMKIKSQDYNINKIQSDLIEKQAKQEQEDSENITPEQGEGGDLGDQPTQ